MARYTFGGEVVHLSVSEDATNVGTETTPRKALAIAPGSAWPLSTTKGGPATTDFMLLNSSTGVYDVPATAITSGSNGFPPSFQGPDNVRVLYDAAGNALVCWEGAAGGGSTSVNGVAPAAGNVALTQDNIPDGTAAKQFTTANQTKLNGIATGATAYTDTNARTAVGLTTGQTAPSLQGDNTFAGTNTFPAASIDSSALAGLDSRFDNYVATKGIPQVRTFANGTTPAITPNTLWLELAAGVTGTPTATLVTHNGVGTDQTTYTFTPDSTMPAASVYIAFVGTGTTVVGGTAVIASSVTGRGLTWTKIGAGTVAGNNATSLVAFRASGTPTASGDFSVTFPSATEACHLEVVAVNNVSSTVTASAYGTASTNLSTPTVTHAPTTINSAHFQLLALQVNTATGSTTADPGTPLGTTPDVTSTGPTLTSRVSYKTSAAQAVTWTRSAAAQYAAASIVLTPA